MNRDSEIDAILAEATEWAQAGNLGEAIETLERSLASHREESILRLKLGHYLSEAGQFARASEIFSSLVAAFPRKEIVSLALFHSLWRQERRAEAIHEMRRFQAQHSSSDYLDMIAEMQEKGILDESLRYIPENDYIYYLPGREPEPDNAKGPPRKLKTVAKTRKVVQLQLQALREKIPSNRGIGLPQSGNPVDQIIRDAADLHKNGDRGASTDLLVDNFLSSNKEATLCVKLGYFYWLEGNLTRAAALLQHAVSELSDSELASLSYFHILWAAGRREEALEEMRRYLLRGNSADYSEMLAELRSMDLVDDELRYIAKNDHETSE